MSKETSLKTALLIVISMMLGALLSSLDIVPPLDNDRREPLTHADLEGEQIPSFPLDTHSHPDEITEARQEVQEVRVLCWVLTTPTSHLSKAVHVRATWGSRCDKLIFISSKNDTELGAIDVGVGEGRQVLWGKTKAALTHAYNLYLEDYDWFFKADDDTYAVMENLRYMLAIYDPNFPIYFGSRFKLFTKQGYMSGGGGYVLSREALKQFIEVSLPNKKLCKGDTNTGAEDAELGKCLDNIGVVAGDSRDSYGRGRFFPFTPVTHLFGLVPDWYLDYVYYKPDMGLNCCSDSAVAFHYVDSHLMYQLEYLLYHLRPHGVYHRLPDPAPLPPDTKSIPFQALRKVAGSGWVAAATERPQQVNHEEQKYMNAVD